MRPLPHAKKLPDSLFWWEGPDGSRLLAYRLPFSYNDEGPVEGRLHKIISELHEPTQVLMAFYGVGDQGGGPLCRDPPESSSAGYRCRSPLNERVPRCRMPVPQRVISSARRGILTLPTNPRG
jgi:hypothetical protein